MRLVQLNALDMNLEPQALKKLLYDLFFDWHKQVERGKCETGLDQENLGTIAESK